MISFNNIKIDKILREHFLHIEEQNNNMILESISDPATAFGVSPMFCVPIDQSNSFQGMRLKEWKTCSKSYLGFRFHI